MDYVLPTHQRNRTSIGCSPAVNISLRRHGDSGFEGLHRVVSAIYRKCQIKLYELMQRLIAKLLPFAWKAHLFLPLVRNNNK